MVARNMFEQLLEEKQRIHKVTSSWFFLSTLNYDARSTTHQIYILPISTVRIQLHVSVLYVDHLQVEIFNLQISYTRYVGCLGGRGGGRDLVVSIVGTMTPSC